MMSILDFIACRVGIAHLIIVLLVNLHIQNSKNTKKKLDFYS